MGMKYTRHDVQGGLWREPESPMIGRNMSHRSCIACGARSRKFSFCVLRFEFPRVGSSCVGMTDSKDTAKRFFAMGNEDIDGEAFHDCHSGLARRRPPIEERQLVGGLDG